MKILEEKDRRRLTRLVNLAYRACQIGAGVGLEKIAPLEGAPGELEGDITARALERLDELTPDPIALHTFWSSEVRDRKFSGADRPDLEPRLKSWNRLPFDVQREFCWWGHSLRLVSDFFTTVELERAAIAERLSSAGGGVRTEMNPDGTARDSAGPAAEGQEGQAGTEGTDPAV